MIIDTTTIIDLVRELFELEEKDICGMHLGCCSDSPVQKKVKELREAIKSLDKLLAVAEAAKKHSDGCADVYGDIHLLDEALEALESDK